MRRELPREEREQAVAKQVHPGQRVPRVVAQLDLAEAHRVELARHEIAVDRLSLSGPIPQLERRSPSGR